MLRTQRNFISKCNRNIFKRQSRSLATPAAVDWKDAKPHTEIPGPTNFFQSLSLTIPGGRYYNLPFDKLLETFRNDFGTIVQFPGLFGMKPMVVTFLPEDVEKVHRTEGKFPSRRPIDSLVYFRNTTRPEMYPAGGGLVATQGQEWYDFRSKVQQIMMQPRATKMYIPGIDGVACDFVDKIRKIRDNNLETPTEFFENINEWSLESIAFIALEARLGLFENPENSNLNKYIKLMFQAFYDFDVQPSIWRIYKTPGFKRALKVYEDTANEVKQFVNEAIERFEKNPSASEQEAGVLEKMVKIDKNIGQTMAEDMLLAGVDTTSSAMTSVMYCLAKNPEKQEILRKEIFSILPEKSSKLTAKSFERIPYLRAVVKEAMRVHPVTSANMRSAGEDLVLQGYRIPKGLDVLLGSSLLALDEENFKRSKEFIPERWLKDNTDAQCPHAKDAHPFTYLPFGFGSRMCIGRRFAELEVEVLTARLLREFRIEWNHEDLKFKNISINLPDGPLRFKMVDI